MCLASTPDSNDTLGSVGAISRLDSFHLVCALLCCTTTIILGDNHMKTTEYWCFWVMLTDAKQDMVHELIDSCGYVQPVHILSRI